MTGQPFTLGDARWLFARTVRAHEIARQELGEGHAEWMRVLEPSEALLGAALWLYQAHVRELLARLLNGEDVAPGTDAECVIALSNASMRRPPGDKEAALFNQLFNSCADRAGRRFRLPGTPPREPYPGAAGELWFALRRRLARPERRL